MFVLDGYLPRTLDGLRQITRVLVFDQVGDDFGIGFRAKAVATGAQLHT